MGANPTSIHELRVWSLVSLSGIQRWRGLWRRLQMQFRSGVAVAVIQAGSCSSDSPPSLGTSICQGYSPKKQKKKKKTLPNGNYQQNTENSLKWIWLKTCVIWDIRWKGDLLKHNFLMIFFVGSYITLIQSKIFFLSKIIQMFVEIEIEFCFFSSFFFFFSLNAPLPPLPPHPGPGVES